MSNNKNNNNSIISSESLAIVQATAPVVQENITSITPVFYSNLLGQHPELYQYFNESNQELESPNSDDNKNNDNGNNEIPSSQSKSTKTEKTPKLSVQAQSLADAVIAYVLNIEHLENLTESIVRITHKHCALGVQPHHYQLVHDALMDAIVQVLGATVVTSDIAAAWSEAIMGLAKLLIQTEDDLYHQAAEEQWLGRRTFVITDIITEAKDIKSFRLVPQEKKQEICPFLPGQYVSVYETPPGKVYMAPRHYTLTSQPTDPYYQITVKKTGGEDQPNDEGSSPAGVMSHYLHSKCIGDTVQLGPVFGPVPLMEQKQRLQQRQRHQQMNREEYPSSSNPTTPRMACFVSVGVGITSTVVMLPTVLKNEDINEKSGTNCYGAGVAVFHADTCPETFAFRQYLEKTLLPIPFMDSSQTNAASTCSPPTILNVSYSQSRTSSLPFYVDEGRLTGQKIIETLQKHNNNIDYQTQVDYFICAGYQTTPAIKNELQTKYGVLEDCIHLEFFGPYVSIPPPEKNENSKQGESDKNFSFFSDLGTNEEPRVTCPFIKQKSSVKHSM